MKRVLVVDDNELSGKLVRSYLGRYGCEVEISTTAFGVLQKIKEYCPDILLLDLNMPGLDGKSFAALLKKNDRGKGIKTILFSAEPEDIQKKIVSDGLVDDYFVKGSSFEGLWQKVL